MVVVTVRRIIVFAAIRYLGEVIGHAAIAVDITSRMVEIASRITIAAMWLTIAGCRRCRSSKCRWQRSRRICGTICGPISRFGAAGCHAAASASIDGRMASAETAALRLRVRVIIGQIVQTVRATMGGRFVLGRTHTFGGQKMLLRQVVATLDVVQIRFRQIQFFAFVIVSGARYGAIEYGAEFRLHILVGRHKALRFDEFADQFLVLALRVPFGQRRRVDGAHLAVEGKVLVEKEFAEAFHVIVATMRRR